MRKVFYKEAVKRYENSLNATADDSEESENDGEDEESTEEYEQKKTKATILASAFVFAIFAAVGRIGGRAALLNALGLDFIAESGIKQQISDFVVYFESLGNLRWVGVFGAWFLAKALCIDAATLVLALSSGVLFGGIVEGTVVSVVCSTISSLLIFYLARYFLRERAAIEIEKRPAFRAIDRACSREGFKTVFTLRLSPLLPIPIGGYNYLYGAATSVAAWDFFSGISLASLKPYFLDSYLGVFGKSVIDGDDSQSDLVLGVVLFVVILVGSFATQIVSSTFDEIQKEAKLLEGQTDGNGTEISGGGVWDLGFTLEDVPSFARGIAGDLLSAKTRIEDVIKDEWRSVQLEANLGGEDMLKRVDEQVNWEGISLSPTRDFDFQNWQMTKPFGESIDSGSEQKPFSAAGQDVPFPSIFPSGSSKSEAQTSGPGSRVSGSDPASTNAVVGTVMMGKEGGNFQYVPDNTTDSEAIIKAVDDPSYHYPGARDIREYEGRELTVSASTALRYLHHMRTYVQTYISHALHAIYTNLHIKCFPCTSILVGGDCSRVHLRKYFVRVCGAIQRLLRAHRTRHLDLQ